MCGDANNLANNIRHIMKKNRLTATEAERIKKTIRQPIESELQTLESLE